MSHHAVRRCGPAAAALAVAAASIGAPADPAGPVTDADRQAIEAALPASAPARPLKPRRLLIFALNVGYGGHRSIAHANLAFERMGRKTGAFETDVSWDPSVFAPANLRRYDAVFFNNTVGNLFEDPALRRSLIEFVVAGGGLMGVHGASVAFTRWPGAHEDWPEFGRLLGARGAAHMPGPGDEPAALKLDDPDHPLNRPFSGRGFAHRSEFFRFGDPFSRRRVRVLMSLDNAASERLQGGPLKPFRADGDYAVAWVRTYGRGRVFYCSLAHHPDVFWDPVMLQFYLGAAQFALGDLPAPTIPSARLTPAIRAQEALGWRLGLEADPHGETTLFEIAAAASRLGLPFIGGSGFHAVGGSIAKAFAPGLADEEFGAVRLRLDDDGVRLLTYRVREPPSGEGEWRRLFEFARQLGIEALVANLAPEDADTALRFSDEFDISVAAAADSRTDPALARHEGRSPRVGAVIDLDGLQPRGASLEHLRAFGDRVTAVRIRATAADGGLVALLREMHRIGLRPAMIGVEMAGRSPDPAAETARRIEAIGRLSLDLTGSGAR